MAGARPGTREIVDAVAAAVEANADALSALDAVGGDGDHGVSLTIGVRAVQAALSAEMPPTLGATLQKIGMTLIIRTILHELDPSTTQPQLETQR